jgi:simple sugar transport system permease protein
MKNVPRKAALAAAAPLMALVFAIIASSIVLLLAGSNPLKAYGDMINNASKLETQIDILNRATPLFLSGIAAAIGFRMNLFNIGVEGQYLLAALVAAEVGGVIHLPAPIHVTVIFLVAMSVGAGYAGIAGALKVTRGISEVISTIMLNAIAISGLIVAGLKAWQAGGAISGNVTRVGTTPIDKSGHIPTLNNLVEIFTRHIGRDRHLTGVFLVAVAVGIAYHVVVNRSRFGYDLRASGANPFAAQAGGVSPKRNDHDGDAAVRRGGRPCRNDRGDGCRAVPIEPDPEPRVRRNRRGAARPQQRDRCGDRRADLRLPRHLVGHLAEHRVGVAGDRADHAGAHHPRRRRGLPDHPTHT